MLPGHKTPNNRPISLPFLPIVTLPRKWPTYEILLLSRAMRVQVYSESPHTVKLLVRLLTVVDKLQVINCVQSLHPSSNYLKALQEKMSYYNCLYVEFEPAQNSLFYFFPCMFLEHAFFLQRRANAGFGVFLFFVINFMMVGIRSLIISITTVSPFTDIHADKAYRKT